MCVSVIINRGGERKWCETIEELSAALGCASERIPATADYPGPWGEKECLCPLDARELAARCGCKLKRHRFEKDFMDEWELFDPNMITETA